MSQTATGVYAIICAANGKRYIGSASRSFATRWSVHQSRLRLGKHHSRHLQASWNKYGEDAFVFAILETCSPADCLAREQHWIDATFAADRRFGYNLRPKASSNLGLRFSQESRRRVSLVTRGRKQSPETRAKLSAAAKLRGIPSETTAKAHASRRGRPLSDEQKAKMSAALKGRKCKPETAAKIAAKLKGRKLDEATCAHYSKCQKGKKHSDATKAKMSETRRGRKHSDAHCQAISDGHKRRRLEAGLPLNRPRGEPVIIACDECGSEFRKVGPALTCGPECSRKRNARRNRERSRMRHQRKMANRHSAQTGLFSFLPEAAQ